MSPVGFAAEARVCVVVAGAVDHGKSTLLGRLLADTDSVPRANLERALELSQGKAPGGEFALLLDSLRDEQREDFTLESARVFVRTARREYLFIDTPGHAELLGSLATGAARASAAFLVCAVDAEDAGALRGPAHVLRAVGVRRILVLANKIDVAGYRESAFRRTESACRAELGRLGLDAAAVVPVSGIRGDNVTRRSEAMRWYAGPTALEALERLPPERADEDLPFRFPVQGSLGMPALGRRRAVIGTLAAGRLRPGDEVVFYPSRRRSVVRAFEGFPPPAAAEVSAGAACAFSLARGINPRRGDLASRVGEPPPLVAGVLHASVFWLGETPLRRGRWCRIRLGTAETGARVVSFTAGGDALLPRDVSECVLRLRRPLAFDYADDCLSTGRFTLLEGGLVRGCGLVNRPRRS